MNIDNLTYGDGLLRLFRLAMGLHVLTGINSTIPETREYWRAKQDRKSVV